MGSDLTDRASFEDMYQRHHVLVVKFLWRRLPADAVEDAAAEVFLLAWRGRRQLRGEVLPWLYGIARRVAADVMRQRERASRLGERLRGSTGEAAGPAAEAAALDRASAVHALRGLSVRDREVLMLVSWEGMDVAGAAKVLGCSAATFAVRLHRARRRLERWERLAADERAEVAKSTQAMRLEERTR
ncbi:sigma-70 family RNA polymerase sigma factor [Actinopolymorpha sp. B17G11]|uniref:RNA polymerase sigma factor n=1 Tax=unclassified Actinopolymorpha TaxID=2627063 RepID=UPI0032D8C1A3